MLLYVKQRNTNVDLLFTCIALIDVRLFQYVKLLFNDNYCM